MVNGSKIDVLMELFEGKVVPRGKAKYPCGLTHRIIALREPRLERKNGAVTISAAVTWTRQYLSEQSLMERKQIMRQVNDLGSARRALVEVFMSGTLSPKQIKQIRYRIEMLGGEKIIAELAVRSAQEFLSERQLLTPDELQGLKTIEHAGRAIRQLWETRRLNSDELAQIKIDMSRIGGDNVLTHIRV